MEVWRKMKSRRRRSEAMSVGSNPITAVRHHVYERRDLVIAGKVIQRPGSSISFWYSKSKTSGTTVMFVSVYPRLYLKIK